MNRTCFLLLTVLSLLHASAASASPRSDTTRECVAASTQGQTDRDEGRLISARQQFLSCVRDECPAIVKKSCGEWLTELEQRIPSVVVRVYETGQSDVTDARVSIDGAPIALDGRALIIDPGPHKIAVEATGWLPVERTFLMAERERARLLSVQLPRRADPAATSSDQARAAASSAGGAGVSSVGSRPSAASASSASDSPSATRGRDQATPRGFTVPVGAWVLTGVGAAGIVSFAILNSQARSALDELKRDCSPRCTPAQRESGERKALIADVSLGVGIAALVGAGAWTLGSWLRQRSSARAAELAFREAGGAGLFVVPVRQGMLAGVGGAY